RGVAKARARLHEHSRVTNIENGRVETAGGSVRARDVVVAVNAAAAAWKPLRRRLTVFGSYLVLTEPVPDLLEPIGWTGGEAVIDGRMFLHYFRTTADGRVVMGSGSGPIGFGGRLDRRFTHDEATVARAEHGLRRLLPDLAGAEITHAWGGPIDVSSDHLPFFGTVPGTRIRYAAGYSGHGVGPSWLAGQVLARLVLGVDDELTRLPLVARRVPKLPPEPVRRLGGGLVRAAIMASEEAEEEERRPSLPVRAGAALPRLLGLRIGTRWSGRRSTTIGGMEPLDRGIACAASPPMLVAQTTREREARRRASHSHNGRRPQTPHRRLRGDHIPHRRPRPGRD